MSTTFDIRRWATQAGIQTTGGFAVIAECVTMDELQRFAEIAIASAGGVQALSAAPAEQQFASSAVLKAIREANMQLVRTGDDAFMLVPYKLATAEQQAAPKVVPGGQNTVPAEWLEQAYREGWAACRDAETIGEEAEDWAFGNSTANSRMIDAQQAAPQQEPASPIRVGWGRDYQDNGKPIDASAAPVPNLAAILQQEAQESSADVLAKIGSNTWDHFGDILPTLKAISRGDWYWGANMRCKYIEIRIDTRDGGCILYDSKRVRISPQQFAHQSHDLGKMHPWPAKNALGDTAPQPAPAPLSRDQIRKVFMAHGFTIKEGQTDLKQYVYDAAYALLGTKPAPLSDEQIRAMCKESWVFETVKQWVRITEQHHGIKGGQHGTE